MPTTKFPIILLTYGDAKCLVATSETFEGMKTLAMNAFDIGGSSANLILKTSCLDICQGSAVRIHESAWETVRSLISGIEVWTSNQIVQSDASDDLDKDNDVTEQLSVSSFVSDHEDIKKAQISRKGKSRQVTARSSNLDVNVADLCPKKRDRSHNSSNHFVDGDQPVNEVMCDAEAGPFYSIKSERQVSSHVQISGQGNGHGTERSFDSDCLPSTQEDKGTLQDLPLHLTQSSIDDETSRFVIGIRHIQSNQSVHFKIRGRHSVGKVVSSACQKFGLDRDSAVLKLIVEVDGEDNQIPCNFEDTMMRAGAQEGSEFILETENN